MCLALHWPEGASRSVSNPVTKPLRCCSPAAPLRDGERERPVPSCREATTPLELRPFAQPTPTRSLGPLELLLHAPKPCRSEKASAHLEEGNARSTRRAS